MGLTVHTDYEHKNETHYLPLHACVPLPLPVGYGTQLGHAHREDVGLVDDFEQHVDVVSPLLFLRLVGSCRR
jgi:hypothetical protein